MAQFKVPPNLPELVTTAFDAARASGALLYFPSHAAIIDVNSIPFQLRYSPALANKPKPSKPATPATSNSSADRDPIPPKPNPFAAPDPALLVAPGALGPTHRLVLNKYAVVPEHFLLVTTAFAPQTHLLAAADLAAARACVLAYRDHPHRAARRRAADDEDGRNPAGLFVFFNSGPHSGASQPHRHLQLLPVARMRGGLDAVERGGAWRLLADQPAEALARLPFATWSCRLDQDAGPQRLREVYLSLYRRACAAAGVGDEEAAREDGEAAINYNLAMTEDSMVLCPRLAEGGVLRDAQGAGVGRVELNGTVLAGTALVKSQTEWDVLMEDTGQLGEVLGRIGVPQGPWGAGER